MSDTIFGKRLKQLRENKKMNQKEFAKVLGITPATLSTYEKAGKYPAVPKLIEIAQKADTSIDWLLGLNDATITQNKIKTYSDIIKLLVDLSKVKNLIIDIKQSEYADYGGGSYRTELCGVLFQTRCFDFEKFFDDWTKMNGLYKNNSIDEEVYNLWIEKTLNKFKDIDISSTENNKDYSTEYDTNDEDLPF